MANACLGIMNSMLKFNACGIPTSHCLNNEIPRLESLVSENISPSLVYACRFWAEHLKSASRDDEHLRAAVQPLLKTLLYEKLLYWLETLSLVKSIPLAEMLLLAAADYTSVRRLFRQCACLTFIGSKGHNDYLAEAANDARMFINEFQEVIAAAATHIYVSALPFCPSDSWMARLYAPQFANLLSVTRGRRVNWDTAATTSDGHNGRVNCVAFFPDGRNLASGSDDETVRVWDSTTGQAISAPFTGHTQLVWSVAVSPDGKLIASGSFDGTLRIWDSHTGACPLGPVAAHRRAIFSVAFSPDGSRIVTGSKDNTLKVWNVETGDLRLVPLTGHTHDINSVAFSPDGTCIASGSDDRTIRIWDASTGESRRESLKGHTSEVRCVAFSADGRYLASAGSADRTIHLWDATQGFAQMAAATLTTSVWSLSFSPNGNCLVSGSNDGEIYFWNISSGNIKLISKGIYGHFGCVVSAVFSPQWVIGCFWLI